jgi:hypothetical protein
MSCAVYFPFMHTSTLTIRLPQEQRATLKETAKRLKKSESDFIREILVREFERISFGERAGEFMGCLESGPPGATKPDSFREAIKRNNWRTK